MVDIKREMAVVVCVMVAARSKAWDSGHTIAGECGFESRPEPVYFSLVNVVCCQVEVSATG